MLIKDLRKVFISVIIVLFLLITSTEQAKTKKIKGKPATNSLILKLNQLESSLLKLQNKPNNENNILDQLTIGYQNIIENWTNLELDGIRDAESLSKIFKHLESIQKKFDSMSKIFAIRKLIKKENLITLAKDILHGNQNVIKLTSTFQKFINKNLFSTIIKELNAKICESTKSPQQFLYDLYNDLEQMNDKALVLVRISQTILKIFKEKKILSASKLRFVQNKYTKFSKNLKLLVKNEMLASSLQLYKCDPAHHKVGTTYLEVTKLLQGYLLNENDLSGTKKCGKNCSDYKYVESAQCKTEKLCSAQKICNGKIRDCKFIASKFDFCPAVDSNRRCDSIRFRNYLTKDRVFGKENTCKKDKVHVEKFRKLLFGFKCDYCFCLCDEEDKDSDRYFNLRPTIANVAANMVVTGLRFTKKKRIIHMQIQQGKLLAKGKIDKDSVEWVPVEEYEITNVTKENGKDFHTFTYEERSIDLDDLKAVKNHVVTGIGFEIKNGHLNFKIHTTPFNFTSGSLQMPDKLSKWVSNNQNEKQRKKINLINPDIPILAEKENVELSTNGSYIELRETDMDADASQTTVPFFDAQPLESNVALSGAGIHHRGQPNQLHFGGFIAPKLFTIDYNNHF